jgi:hypothetical protein
MWGRLLQSQWGRLLQPHSVYEIENIINHDKNIDIIVPSNISMTVSYLVILLNKMVDHVHYFKLLKQT